MTLNITVPLTKGSVTLTVTGWMDASNNIYSGLPTGYSSPSYTIDNPAVADIVGMGLACQIQLKTNGAVNVTATCSKSGGPDLTLVASVTVSGPVPVSLAGTLA